MTMKTTILMTILATLLSQAYAQTGAEAAGQGFNIGHQKNPMGCKEGTKTSYIEIEAGAGVFMETYDSDFTVSGGSVDTESEFRMTLFNTGNEQSVKLNVWTKSGGKAPEKVTAPDIKCEIKRPATPAEGPKCDRYWIGGVEQNIEIVTCTKA